MESNQTRKNISEKQIITEDNLKSMIDAYNYGTATPMQWLINTLKLLRGVLENQQVTVCIKKGNTRILSKSDFNGFVLEYFNQFTLNESLKDEEKSNNL